MKRLASLLFALWIASICFAKSALLNYEYDIVGVAIAKEGYYLVEVSTLVDKKGSNDRCCEEVRYPRLLV